MCPTKQKEESVSKEQPNHPGQVFGYPGDGVELVEYSNGQKQSSVIITVNQVDEQWMLIHRVWVGGIFDGREDTITMSMADNGMVPYSHGLWNRHNYVTLGD